MNQEVIDSSVNQDTKIISKIEGFKFKNLKPFFFDNQHQIKNYNLKQANKRYVYA